MEVGELNQASVAFKNSLVGFFVGKWPPWPWVKASLAKAWRMPDLEVESLENSFFRFKFSTLAEGQRILEEGPWFVGGHPLALIRWEEDRTFQKEELSTIPIWVKFPNLRMTCRSITALSKISSCIGNPIYMDKPTAAGERIAYAKVLVDISVDATLPDSLTIGCNGKLFAQEVEYYWKPKPCTSCGAFNHSNSSCPVQKTDHSKAGVTKNDRRWKSNHK